MTDEKQILRFAQDDKGGAQDDTHGIVQRVCVKLYAEEPEGLGDQVFVPIFHEWIRDRALDMILIDVADYTHAPDSPGVMLVAHEASFALDRADGRFGLLVQRRRPIDGSTADAIATSMRHALVAADRLERDHRLSGRVGFDRRRVRVETNDRLRAPNSDAGFASLEPAVRVATAAVFGERGRFVRITRCLNDPRDRLAVEVQFDD